MHRMRNDIVRRKIRIPLVSGALVVLLVGLCASTRGDLIRPHGFRSYPDIAGDIVGAQTYAFDPESQTGVFRVTNAPHVITLGPTGGNMVDVTPDHDGTLNESLQLTLDRDGRLVDEPGNKFELYGSVEIGGKVYKGLLLEGRPTAFGAQALSNQPARTSGVFDLSLKVTGGKLAEAFGPEAYFRITPQANSTFQGDFAASFSGDKPLTSLRASRQPMVAPVPEPTSILFVLTCGAGIVGSRLHRRRRMRRRIAAVSDGLSRPGASPTAFRAPRSRSGEPAPSSARGIRRSP
ncbi:MAG: PEP-CTERM sorting domain-containing protein [Paludisphaera borealis]|uniref:PEP-CTERM sorting domain-containing protein n=1 Tax=Paludisphaera borealis TaxID=1387353 RepID=UPI00283C65F1|nr:PEP-CTERM sorting domain-containing protein [Paludisphaera borealis]MDR3618468.1 PEP-CTERM sorting domain-containing protein [Paludisphaera borealis]